MSPELLKYLFIVVFCLAGGFVFGSALTKGVSQDIDKK